MHKTLTMLLLAEGEKVMQKLLQALLIGLSFTIVVIGIMLVYHVFPPPFVNMWDLLPFFILVVICTLLPIHIHGTPFILLYWVTVPAFLTYGLFVEMLLFQLPILCLLLSRMLGKPRLYHYFINSIILFATSIVSGSAYYLVGGDTNPVLNRSFLFPIVLYILLLFVINQGLVYVVDALSRDKQPFFAKKFFIELLTTMLLSLLGIGVYYLYASIGNITFLLMGLPFISIVIVIKYYQSYSKMSKYLQKASAIGHELTEKRRVPDVIPFFMEKASQVMMIDHAFLFDKNVGAFIWKDGKYDCHSTFEKKINDGISSLVMTTGKGVLFHDKAEWSTFTQGELPNHMESILSVPLRRDQKIEGIFMIASIRKKAYHPYHLLISDLLCSYLAAAMVNARHYEKLKQLGEYCHLTKLFNYRYFQHLLEEQFVQLKNANLSVLSLLILDIDHFKNINDTYGHQAGNHILIEVANRISAVIGKLGTVARYGGEEFVALLPDVPCSRAMKIAENVRLEIAAHPFTIQHDLASKSSEHDIYITVSIGVATAPMDGEDSIALIRHADRALYIGAKQAGRNRVAHYENVSEPFSL